MQQNIDFIHLDQDLELETVKYECPLMAGCSRTLALPIHVKNCNDLLTKKYIKFQIIFTGVDFCLDF